MLTFQKISSKLCALSIALLSLSACDNKSEGSSGNFVTRIISDIYNFFVPAEKDGAELIKTEAEASKTLQLEYPGPKGAKAKKPEVDLNKIEDSIAPLPAAEEPSKDDRSESTMRKEVETKAAIQNMETEATLVRDLDNKKLKADPDVPVSNTLADEQQAKAPHSIEEVEAKLMKSSLDK